jgi:hypothetical protein
MKIKSSTPHRFSLEFSAFSFFFALLATPSLHAANATWNGTTDANWATLDNWSGPPASVPAGSADTATFNNGGNGNTTISLTGGPSSISTVIFDPGAAAYTIGTSGQSIDINRGGAITLNSGVTTNQTFNKITLSSNTAAATGVTITNNGTGSLNFGTIDRAVRNVAQTIVVSGSGNINVGQFTKTGGATNNTTLNKTGTLTLTDASTMGGTINISDGSLVMGSSGTLGTGSAITLGGGDLKLGGTSQTVGT